MKEIFLTFLKFGFLGFGGPLSLVAMLQKELVEEKKWISHEEFQSAFALIKSMPGPVAFQTAVFLAYKRAGFWGALSAGAGLVLPAFVMMVLLAAYYDRLSGIHSMRSIFDGMAAAAIALVIMSIYPLGKGFYRESRFWLILFLSMLIGYFHLLPEPIVILLAGVFGVIQSKWKEQSSLSMFLIFSMDPSTIAVLKKIFWISFQAGAFVFGTGLAIVPFLEKGFVSDMGWISSQTFMDALSFGQITPGPVVITVSFLGYKVAGIWGAIVGTVGVFLPSFFHMTTWFPRMLSWLQNQKWIKDFTLNVTAAVIGAILVSVQSLVSYMTSAQILMCVAFCILTFKYIKRSWVIIVLGALTGLLLRN